MIKGSGTQNTIYRSGQRLLRQSAIWEHRIWRDIFVSEIVYWFLSKEQVMLVFIVILKCLLQYTNFTRKWVIWTRKKCCFYYCCKIVEIKHDVGWMIPIREKNWGNTTACVLHCNHTKMIFQILLYVVRMFRGNASPDIFIS